MKVSDFQKIVGEDHLALKFARQVVKGGLGGPTIASRCLAIPCELCLPNDCWHHGCDATFVRMKLEERTNRWELEANELQN